MTQETMRVQIERARSQARDLDASADVRDRWYQRELQRIEAQAESDRQVARKTEKLALLDDGRRAVRELLHPDKETMHV